MNDNKPQTYVDKPNLMLVRTEDAEKMHAKLINLNNPVPKNEVGLPPQPENYIKVKKHDFL